MYTAFGVQAVLCVVEKVAAAILTFKWQDRATTVDAAESSSVTTASSGVPSACSSIVPMNAHDAHHSGGCY